MKDFAPEAEHLPFFVPPSLPPRKETRSAAGLPFKIVHATNHPGIEGTARIEAAVDALRKKGFSIDFVFLKGVPHERVLAELVDADLSIGKMKMGYYANAQVESMAMGVPTLTWIRPDLMTDALRQSGLIVCSLDELEAVLERCLRNPEELRASGLECRRSVGKLHDNDAIAKRLIELYRGGRA
jgi:glycosyltransferase involved in cell wall biosynthesis